MPEELHVALIVMGVFLLIGLSFALCIWLIQTGIRIENPKAPPLILRKKPRLKVHHKTDAELAEIERKRKHEEQLKKDEEGCRTR